MRKRVTYFPGKPILFSAILKKRGPYNSFLFVWVGTSPCTTLTCLSLDQITWGCLVHFETGGTSAVTGPVPPPAADVVPRSSGFLFCGGNDFEVGAVFFIKKVQVI